MTETEIKLLWEGAAEEARALIESRGYSVSSPRTLETDQLFDLQSGYQSGSYVEDAMQRTNFYYDSNPFPGGSSYSHYVAGRLAAVLYYGGHCSSYATPHTGCDLIQEWYNYNPAGAMLGKNLIVTRGSTVQSLTGSWTVDT